VTLTDMCACECACAQGLGDSLTTLSLKSCGNAVHRKTVERSRTAKSKTQARAANVMHGIRVAAEMTRPAKHEAGVDWLMSI
jgi:hypothetical protein